MKRRPQPVQAKVKAIAVPRDAALYGVTVSEWAFRVAVFAVVWGSSVAAATLLWR